MQFAKDEAKKQAEKGANYACIEDKVVYGWAIHYFEEDSIIGKLYNEDGSEYQEKVKTDTKSISKPTEIKKPESPQINLFDMMATKPEPVVTKPTSPIVEIDPSIDDIWGDDGFNQVMTSVANLGVKKQVEKHMVFYYVCGYITGWFSEGLTKEPKWYESDKWGTAEDKYFNPFAPIVNLDYVKKFPKYHYSAIEQYAYNADLSYLRLYEQYPKIEYLVKLGLSSLALSKMILKHCHKDKRFRKWLAQHKDEIINHNFNIAIVIRAYKQNGNLQNLQSAENVKKELRRNRSDYMIHQIFSDRMLTKFSEYLNKQNANLNYYLDYVEACRELGIDLRLNKNRMPNNFHYWHDMRIDQYRSKRMLEDKRCRELLFAKFAKVATKYLALERLLVKDNYICLIAKSPNELVIEGEKLHHCVGRMNYDQKFTREETLIFFIRNRLAPNIPLVTLEYSLSNHKVLQCYADHDNKPTDEILHFVNKVWLPYANRKIKAIA